MRQLIVNADDFGLTEQVSRGILDAHRQGIVTSTTLMANGRAFDFAVSLSRGAPKLGVGAHLNLTQGQPVSPAWKVPSLVNREGRLHLSPGQLLRGILSRQVDLADVEIELRAQIAKICRADISPTHLDGHKHVHVLPGVSEIVIRLAQQFSVQCIRVPSEDAPDWSTLLRNAPSRSAVAKQYLVGRAVSAFAWRFKATLAKAGLLFPLHFYGLSQTGFLDAQSTQEILERLPEGVSELMCHPGYPDDDLVKTGTRLLAQREVEIQALTAPRVRRLVAERGVELVNFGQVGAPVQEGALAARRTTTPVRAKQVRAVLQEV